MESDSTTADVAANPVGWQGRWSGRLGILVLVSFVVAGLTGVLGVQTRTASDEGGGYELDVEYPWLTRSGQPAPFHLRISHVGGFPGQTVTVEICDDLFDALDFQNWYPVPSAETGDRGRIVYEFDTPPGDVLEVSLDARIGPGELFGHDSCEVAVLDGGVVVASVEFDNWRLP